MRFSTRRKYGAIYADPRSRSIGAPRGLGVMPYRTMIVSILVPYAPFRSLSLPQMIVLCFCGQLIRYCQKRSSYRRVGV